MRGPSTGALSGTYLHSGITEGLWCAVAETERLFGAKLAHAAMLASLCGHSRADLDEGNDLVHEMYVEALHTFPYVKAASRGKPSANDELVAEWRKVNAEEAAKKVKAAEGAAGAGEGVSGG